MNEMKQRLLFGNSGAQKRGMLRNMPFIKNISNEIQIMVNIGFIRHFSNINVSKADILVFYIGSVFKEYYGIIFQTYWLYIKHIGKGNGEIFHVNISVISTKCKQANVEIILRTKISELFQI